MQLFRMSELASTPDESPIFVGDVTRQSMIGERDAKLLRVNNVQFHDGARNKLHHHEADQVLVVTGGERVVATETEQFQVRPGDVILVPAGERHWHGAQPGKDFSHLAILTPGALTVDEV
jgi:quercetin dioxygenase-like cupin family protein